MIAHLLHDLRLINLGYWPRLPWYNILRSWLVAIIVRLLLNLLPLEFYDLLLRDYASTAGCVKGVYDRGTLILDGVVVSLAVSGELDSSLSRLSQLLLSHLRIHFDNISRGYHSLLLLNLILIL